MSDVVDNRGEQRYELVVDGHRAIAAYERDGDVVTFTHTVVPEELRGQGIASRLIKAALNDVREQGGKVIAQCQFVRAYIESHPEESDLLAA